MNNKKVAIITPANLPVPAIKGGAVESLIDNLCDENEKYKKLNIDVYSIYDREINKDNVRKKTIYKYIQIPKFIKLLDNITYFFMRKVLGKNNSSFRYFFQHIYFIIMVAGKISDSNYDDVVVENYAMMLWCMKLFSNNKKYKNHYYYHMHNVVTHFFGCKGIFLSCKKILGVSNYVLNTLPDDVKTSVTCEVLRNGINTASFETKLSPQKISAMREKYSLEDKKIVVFVGRFVPEKGIKELLEAWGKIDRRDANLLIVGGTFFKTDVKTGFEEEMYELSKKIGSSVKFTGYVNYKEVPKFYALADLIVIPSVWNDPAPLTILESLTAQRPLITTNSGGIPEYLNGNGIIVQRDSHLVDNLAKAISNVLDNKVKVPLKNSEGIDIEDYYKRFIRCLS